MGVDWIKLKREKDREKEKLRSMPGGDVETNADIEYLLKNRDEDIKSLDELRARRKALDRRIDEEANKERQRIEEEKQAIKIKAIENFTIANLNEHIFVTINGKRLKKMKSFEDLKCPKCGKMIYRARGMAIEAAEHYVACDPDRTAMGSVLPGTAVENLVCHHCKETNNVLVQVVY